MLLAADADAARAARFADLTRDLPGPATAAYRHIEWHTDARSGYRWDPREDHLDVRLAPRHGADIKWPRELSRFQHLPALALTGRSEDRMEALLQVLDWIAANPVRRGVNWASAMDVAIRAVNWVWALRLLEPVRDAHPASFFEIRRSLYEHGLHVEQNLEYYEECTSNHYLANVAGLLYLGSAFPEFPESDRWLAFGLQELVSEMSRQVYADGADFEASTHYHRLVAELFVSCAALAERLPDARRRGLRDVRPSRSVRPALSPLERSGIDLSPGARLLPDGFYLRLSRMAHFTAALTKPNGLVPQIGDNDSARLHKLQPPEHDSRDHRHLCAAVGRLLGDSALEAAGSGFEFEAALIAGASRTIAIVGETPGFFPNAGIAVLRSADAHLTVTCGPNGQHGRGGHGHNDKLSFELQVAARDLIVDGGCFTYTADPAERNRFRSTAAHNTIHVCGVEQDPIPAGLAGLFGLPERASRRLDPPDGCTVSGQFDGFGVRHRRTWTLLPGRLIIEDHFDGRSDAWIAFNLDPAVGCRVLSDDGAPVHAELQLNDRTVLLSIDGASAAEVGPGVFSAGYGMRRDNIRLAARLCRPTCRTVFEWTP